MQLGEGAELPKPQGRLLFGVGALPLIITPHPSTSEHVHRANGPAAFCSPKLFLVAVSLTPRRVPVRVVVLGVAGEQPVAARTTVEWPNGFGTALL